MVDKIKKAAAFIAKKLAELNAWIHRVLGVVNSKEFELIRLIYSESFTQLTRNAKLANFEIVRLTTEINSLKEELNKFLNPQENTNGKESGITLSTEETTAEQKEPVAGTVTVAGTEG